ncbi:unnamed protein product, partial [Hapterophycus canaliculatus]
ERIKVIEVGVRKPGAYEMERLGTGEVGYLVCGVKNVLDARVGDTITSAKDPSNEPLDGYAEAKPMVFCGLYPTDAEDYEVTRRLSFHPAVSFIFGSIALFAGLDRRTQRVAAIARLQILRDSLGKLKLNDAALSYEPEASSAMGFGFRC